MEFSLGFPYIVRVGEDAVLDSHISRRKKLELRESSFNMTRGGGGVKILKLEA